MHKMKERRCRRGRSSKSLGAIMERKYANTRHHVKRPASEILAGGQVSCLVEPMPLTYHHRQTKTPKNEQNRSQNAFTRLSWLGQEVCNRE
jgi:hypothetical protein